jgi:hypothetical protein
LKPVRFYTPLDVENLDSLGSLRRSAFRGICFNDYEDFSVLVVDDLGEYAERIGIVTFEEDIRKTGNFLCVSDGWNFMKEVESLGRLATTKPVARDFWKVIDYSPQWFSHPLGQVIPWRDAIGAWVEYRGATQGLIHTPLFPEIFNLERIGSKSTVRLG